MLKMSLRLCLLPLLVFNFIAIASSQNCIRGGMMDNQCIAEEFQNVMDDFMEIEEAKESVGSEFEELGEDFEEIADIYQPLLDCHTKFPFPFKDCYRNVEVQAKKEEKGMSFREFEDYKCATLVGLIECIELKTSIYCGLSEAGLMMELIGMFKPIFENECNKTGIVLSHMVQFSF
ncbi:uncharacterized protein [Parasteatoda tepidariorum]|uniref:uncharacterized protein n=1 Tax=Parasteatoda tepidariorum TaxID=114398 RepID=UPI00077FE11B|nr:uncharacterized protein LOC107452688 [Parasteatoda tepidariorum]